MENKNPIPFALGEDMGRNRPEAASLWRGEAAGTGALAYLPPLLALEPLHVPDEISERNRWLLVVIGRSFLSTSLVAGGKKYR